MNIIYFVFKMYNYNILFFLKIMSLNIIEITLKFIDINTIQYIKVIIHI